jgi:hypothetical protein
MVSDMAWLSKLKIEEVHHAEKIISNPTACYEQQDLAGSPEDMAKERAFEGGVLPAA